jgi:hypothetical protein
MRTILTLLALAVMLAACSDNAASPNGGTPPAYTNQDSIDIVNPPASGYQTSLAGTWRCERYGGNGKWFATYVIAGNTMWAEALQEGSWYPTIDLRVAGSRVWWEAYPIPFAPMYSTFNGVMAGDSIVGRELVWTKGRNGQRIPDSDSLWALTFRRQ